MGHSTRSAARKRVQCWCCGQLAPVGLTMHAECRAVTEALHRAHQGGGYDAGRDQAERQERYRRRGAGARLAGY